jgi:hypothetical protein
VLILSHDMSGEGPLLWLQERRVQLLSVSGPHHGEAR